MNVSKTAWGVIALFAAASLFWLATRVDVYYATSPYGLTNRLFGANVPLVPHPWWFAAHLWLRKGYSIVAFAIVGFTADRALKATQRPRLRAAVLVALYSLTIEIVQYMVDPPEGLFMRAIDVACGALGGWSGVAIYCWIARQRIRAEHVAVQIT